MQELMQASEVAIVPAEQPDPFVVTALGLRLHHEPTFDEWYTFGRKLWSLRTGLQWCVGDWLVYGEGRGDWGEMYAQAMDLTQYSYQTVGNLIWVSSKIEISRRRELSWSHHEAVASLSPVQQDALLTRATKEEWSREDMRAEVKRLAGRATPPKPVRIEFDVCSVGAWYSDGRRAIVELPDQEHLQAVIGRHPGATLTLIVSWQPAATDGDG